MDFDLQNSRPIWMQLSEQLGRRIVTGAYPPGSRFPTVRDLAAEAGVNPNTMQRALGQLESEGLVITNRTVGRTVTEDVGVLDAMRNRLAAELREKYFSEMKELGYSRAQAAEFAAAKTEEET
ncbi:MAG: GntR family transcriptional regulator [Oscillospiraceae bacterium]|nr:GntR family transcriptional regulator [Oscillospiraceae bacterium]